MDTLTSIGTRCPVCSTVLRIFSYLSSSWMYFFHLILQFCPSWHCGLQRAPGQERRAVTFSELTRGTTCGVRAYKLCSVHVHSVSQIIFVSELEAFISCSSIDSVTSVYIGDIYHRRATRISLTKVPYNICLVVYINGWPHNGAMSTFWWKWDFDTGL